MRVNKKLQQVVGASALMMTSICFASSTNTAQESEGLWDKFTRNVSTTWDSDQYDIYIPVLTWHNRFTYDKEKTDSYNENPWGFGLGKYRYDEDNDWHALYAMAFMDSHNKVEPIAGYAFQKCGSQANWMVLKWGQVSR